MAIQLSAYPQLLNDANLVYYSKFEGNSNDYKGINNGTDTAITYGTNNGKFGQGASLNGSTSKIVLPANSYTKPTGSFSISFWIKSTNTSAWKPIYFARKLATYFSGVCILLNNSSIYFFCGANTGTGFPANYFDVNSTGVYVNDGNWHHVVCVHNSGSTIKIYIDGVQRGTNDYIAGVAYDASIVPTIGFDGTTYFNGNIDDLAIFTRALSAAEILSYYNATAGSFFNFF